MCLGSFFVFVDNNKSNNKESEKAHVHSKRALKARNINMNIQIMVKTNKTDMWKIQLKPYRKCLTLGVFNSFFEDSITFLQLL